MDKVHGKNKLIQWKTINWSNKKSTVILKKKINWADEKCLLFQFARISDRGRQSWLAARLVKLIIWFSVLPSLVRCVYQLHIIRGMWTGSFTIFLQLSRSEGSIQGTTGEPWLIFVLFCRAEKDETRSTVCNNVMSMAFILTRGQPNIFITNFNNFYIWCRGVAFQYEGKRF